MKNVQLHVPALLQKDFIYLCGRVREAFLVISSIFCLYRERGGREGGREGEWGGREGEMGGGEREGMGEGEKECEREGENKIYLVCCVYCLSYRPSIL